MFRCPRKSDDWQEQEAISLGTGASSSVLTGNQEINVESDEEEREQIRSRPKHAPHNDTDESILESGDEEEDDVEDNDF